MTPLTRFASFIVTAHLFACSSSAPNESTGVVGLAIDARGDLAPGATSIVMLDDGATAFDVSEASIHLRDIELDLPNGESCDDAELVGAECAQDKITIPGPFVVDLVTGATTPSLDDVTIPAGVYERIDLRVEDGDPDDGLVMPGDALDDRSFVVRADFELDGTPTSLDLSLKFNEDIRIERSGGVQIEPDQDLLATFLAGTWLDGIDVTACVDDDELTIADGTVTIDDDSTSGSCSDVENVIKNNMKNSGQLDYVD